MECSGGKAGKSVIGRRRNSADAWREVRRWRRASGRQTQRKRPLCDAGFGHAHAASLGVILLWSWAWRSLAASETKKANQNAVTVRRREERSDETFNNYSAIAADFP